MHCNAPRFHLTPDLHIIDWLSQLRQNSMIIFDFSFISCHHKIKTSVLKYEITQISRDWLSTSNTTSSNHAGRFWSTAVVFLDKLTLIVQYFILIWCFPPLFLVSYSSRPQPHSQFVNWVKATWQIFHNHFHKSCCSLALDASDGWSRTNQFLEQSCRAHIWSQS